MVSRLKKQKIRDIWKTEDKDFTPWLVQNIALLNVGLRKSWTAKYYKIR